MAKIEIFVAPGRYVVAVSGGVDSVVLLHLLSKAPDLQLIVAHFDHGIRDDSGQDRELVQALSAKYGLPFVSESAHLGSGTSEAVARAARWKFLESVRETHQATAVLTAHHEDDALETAIINLIRGTGRRGLTSLANTAMRQRPLLEVPKQKILEYAREAGLEWREDSTNSDPKYLRNYLRQSIVPRFSARDRQSLMAIITRLRDVNQELDDALEAELAAHTTPDGLERAWFRQANHAEAMELMAQWLRSQGLRAFESHTLERAVIAAKVQRNGSAAPLKNGLELALSRDFLALKRIER
jgi:tRNA(Ile)-lysidine synthetase-like protein